MSRMQELFLFFGEVLIIAGCFALVVMVLAIFFKWLPKLGPKIPGIHVRSSSALFGEDRFYDVILSSGYRLKALKYEGMVQTDNDGEWALRGLAVMRRADGKKVILKTDNVRVFEEVAQNADQT
jgi:hypothetical protein